MEDSDNLDLDGELTEEERALENSAFEFIKVNKQELIKKFADPLKYQPVNSPVSLFMAGSPGAGKTEISKSLIGKFIDIPIRIDADEIRQMCPLYTGSNAHIFQKAANKGVNILFDHAIHKKLNLILDGTFAYAYAEENIKRSINKGRVVELWFVYQDPHQVRRANFDSDRIRMSCRYGRVRCDPYRHYCRACSRNRRRISNPFCLRQNAGGIHCLK
jgi:hypothetical protein